MNALHASNVSLSYRSGKSSVPVLQNLSLEIPAGSFEAIMGPSGSGKSTLLHLAAGLLSPDSGSIRIGNAEISAMSDSQASRFRRRHIGVVFQDFNLLESLTVRENAVMPLKLDRAPVDSARLDSLLEKLSVARLANRLPAELSGGERQRAAIARALLPKPDIILADEPTGNLDVESARQICSLLQSLNSSEGAAILLVTHDPMVAAAASKVHFIKHGSVCASFPTSRDPSLISARYLETYR